jgi:hypothetical protein
MATCVCGREIIQPVTGRPRKRCDRCSPKQDTASRLAPVAALPAVLKARSGRSLAKRTLAELEAAGRLETSQGEAALSLAELFDAGGYTAQGAAALVKAHREALDLALAGAGSDADVIDLIFGEQA